MPAPIWTRRRVAPMSTVAAALLVLGMAGCGSNATPAADNETVATADATTADSATATPSAKVELPSNEDLLSYFKAVAGQDASTLKRAQPLAEKGSLADAYLGYSLASANAGIDGGTSFESAEIQTVGSGYKACYSDDSCTTWDNVTGRDGKIVAFTVNDEKIGPRISVGSGKKIDGPLGTLEFLYAYKSVQSGNFFVLVHVKSKDQHINLNSYSAIYRDPAGRQITASDAVGPTELAANSSATVDLVFKADKVGGQVTLELDDDDYLTPQETQFKTR